MRRGCSQGTLPGGKGKMTGGGLVGKNSSHHRGLAGRPGPGSPGLDHPDTGRPGPLAPGGDDCNGLAVGGLGCAVAVPAWSVLAALGTVGCGVTATLPSTCTMTCVSAWVAGPTK